MMTDMGGQRKRKKEMYYSGGTVEAPYEIYENLRQDQPVTLIQLQVDQVTTSTFLLLLGSSFKIKYQQSGCILAEKGEKGEAFQFED